MRRLLHRLVYQNAAEWDPQNTTFDEVNSIYANIWRSGFKRLRFPVQVETEYRGARRQGSRRRMTTAAITALVGLGLWIGLDAALAGYFQFPLAWTTLGSIGLVIAVALTLLAIFRGKYESYVPWAVTAVRICIGLALIYLQTVMEMRGMPGAIYPYIVLLIALGIAFMSATMTWYTTLAGIVTALIFGISQFVLFPVGTSHPAYELYFLMVMIAIGTAGSWRLEHKDREQFLLSRILAQLAERDSLSGLLNHGAFVSHCERAWRQAAREGKPVALITLDIDYFKRFNDYYGHPAGDKCIAQVGEILNQKIRRGLDAGARLGGEEFATFWYDIPKEQANKIAEDIRKSIEALAIPHKPSSVARSVTVSVGVLCATPKPTQAFIVALQTVDNALYRAKKAGRNQIVVELNLLASQDAVIRNLSRRNRIPRVDDQPPSSDLSTGELNS